MAKRSSDRDVRMYGPILDVLRDVGGEAPARFVMQRVADIVLGETSERHRILRSGDNAAENEVAWARNTLREAGLIESPTRGTWRLTQKGWQAHFDLQEAREFVRREAVIGHLHSKLNEIEPEVSLLEEPEVVKPSLLEIMQNLPPKGFERLCQRVLREAGFSEVTVTGKAGDGGIDGHGVLQINELVSFNVLFQCKRYVGSVGSPEIRNFRGAMTGRTDKGIFLTTGSFSSDAQKEAAREGAPPIELVDQVKLVSLMERLQIGVKPRVVYDVDEEFFEPFRGS